MVVCTTLYNYFTRLNHESFHPSPPSLGFVSKRTQRNVKVAYPHLFGTRLVLTRHDGCFPYVVFVKPY